MAVSRNCLSWSTLLIAAAWPHAAQAGELQVTVEGIRSDKGSIRATLCGDPALFMRACRGPASATPARRGSVVLRFDAVADGSHALSVFHDENDNERTEIPSEGFAFGNDTGFPPRFDAAAIRVDGVTRAKVTLTYLPGPAAAGPSGPAPTYARQVPRVTVAEDGLVGEYYAVRDTPEPMPAIIVMSGSDGSMEAARNLGRRFADHGYAVLVLAYWREPGLPRTLQEIPIEYFDKAVAWLARREGVDPRRIGMLGWSKGAEAALIVASRNPGIGAVVALAPSNSVWSGFDFRAPGADKSSWSLAGRPLPYLTAPTTGDMAENFRRIVERPEALIPVEHIRAPILLVSGTRDGVWPADEMASRIVARLKAKGFRYPYRHLRYADAGHAVFVGGPQAGPPFDGWSAVFGGTSEANRAAWADSWPQVLAFFDTSLKAAKEHPRP